jgi:hypothetical protein
LLISNGLCQRDPHRLAEGAWQGWRNAWRRWQALGELRREGGEW